MYNTDVIIIGGGPAGSTCAWHLLKNGVDCLVLDRQLFPRTKLCAGWITPQVLRDLQFSTDEYPHELLSFPYLDVYVKGLHFKYRSRQYSIRRYEFDHWLLQRSSVTVVTHEARSLVRKDGRFEIDNKFSAPYLIGAGGTHCPVYKTFFREIHPRTKDNLIVTLEAEFPYNYADGTCYLWFLQNDLPGYSWYVPKGDGWINIGIGAYQTRLQQNFDTIRHQWQYFTKKLKKLSLVTASGFSPRGYSYYIRGTNGIIERDNAMIIGDAAGLATCDMGEGIGPAVQSGLLAAEAILNNKPLSFKSVPQYSIKHPALLRLIGYGAKIFSKA
jgi:flavin-dependent dehydrogenase